MDELSSEIDRFGSVSFARFLELALYGPSGFYTRGRGAGRRRDFLTSVEVGPLFGTVLAVALDRWWDQLGRPDPFVIVEAGAGTGQLARTILRAEPACASALRYVLVERSERAREQQAAGLPVVVPSQVFAVPTEADGDAPSEGSTPAPPSGPLVTSLDTLPAVSVDGVVLANELLDNLPFTLLERGDAGWDEVRVTKRAGSLAELVVPATDTDAAQASALAPEAPIGARIPLQRDAQDWLRAALDVVARGRVVVIDYAATTSDLATRPSSSWLRTYRHQSRGGAPLEVVGEQDITAEVAIDQLASVRRPTSVTSQRELLVACGIDELVEAGRQGWLARAGTPDLLAFELRSRVGEADALLDPAGLGGFTVLEWVVG